MLQSLKSFFGQNIRKLMTEFLKIYNFPKNVSEKEKYNFIIVAET